MYVLNIHKVLNSNFPLQKKKTLKLDGSNSHEEIEDSSSIMNNLDLMNISKITYAPKTENIMFL